MVPSYAIIFKPFYYSRDAERQLARLVSHATHGVPYVLADETRRAVPGFHQGRRVNLTERVIGEQGFAEYPQGRVFWFNADYPLYHLHNLAPSYDYYVMVEYDAAVNCDLDELVISAAATETDLIAQRIETPITVWRWTNSCRDIYEESDIEPRMLCFSVFSNRAVAALKAVRLQHSAAWRRGQMPNWPIAEGFVGSEMRRQGMRVRDLHQYGNLSHYDVWPPVHPWELPFMSDQAVIHPVVTGRRYVTSLLRNGVTAALRAKLGLLSDQNMAYRHLWTARSGAKRPTRDRDNPAIPPPHSIHAAGGKP